MPSDTTLAPPPPVRADAGLHSAAPHDQINSVPIALDAPRTASDADVFASVLPDALDTIAQGVVVYDASDRLMYANRRFGEIYQISAHTLEPGTARDDVVQAQARRLSRDPKRITDYLAMCRREQRAPYAGVRMLPDGRSVSVTRRSLPDGTIVATHEDVTDRMGVERRIAHAAHHDALTGLPNRAHFTDQLDTAMKRVRRGDRVALLLLDLDKFKAVNDTHGHGVGDLLLAAVAAKLSAIVREADVVARLGGDEFAILQVPAATPEDAEAFAARITDEMTKPYLLAGKTIFCGISVGIALATEEMTDAAMLLQQADFALYRAKDEGRGAYRFFERELDRQFRNRRKLEADLRRALVVDELALHYQPIVNLEHARVDTIEALVRWRHNGAWISPGQFVPLAEDTGLILPMGDWVVRQACQDAASLDTDVSVAVNVSPLQFRSGDIIESVDRALFDTGLDPERLQIEVTESLLLDTTTDVAAMLAALDDRGVTLALDDFGTGYSSLSYLVGYPFKKLKIDRSFITGLPEASKKLAILRAMAALGSDLGLATTLEGVETNEQLDIALAERCTEVQGYYFAKPVPREQLVTMIQTAEALARGGPGPGLVRQPCAIAH